MSCWASRWRRRSTVVSSCAIRRRPWTSSSNSPTPRRRPASLMIGGQPHRLLRPQRRTVPRRRPVRRWRATRCRRPRVVAGETFRLRVVRGGGELRINWNGTELPPIADPGGELGAVRLRPHRDTMRVRRFVVEGGARPPEPIGESVLVWQSGEDGVAHLPHPGTRRRRGRCAARVLRGAARRRQRHRRHRHRHEAFGRWSGPHVCLRRARSGTMPGNTCGNPCPVVIGDGGDIALLGDAQPRCRP